MKKRLLFVVEAFGGGIFTYLYSLSNKLIDSYDICIAYSIRKQTPRNFESYFDNRVQFRRVTNFTREISLARDLKAIHELKKISNDFKPDIIHFHSSKAGIIGRLGFASSKEKKFYTPHGYSFLMQNTSLIKRSIYWLIEKLAALTKCTTISCSQGEQLQSLRLTRHTILINNGVDVSELNNALNQGEDSSTPDQHSVLTIGRISKQKNPELFNSLALKNPKFRFVWVGDGELRHVLTAPNIIVTGWMNRTHALQQLRSAKYFILPSLWEGLPISLLEAMYARKICLVSDVVGNHDVISDGLNGFVCKGIADFNHRIQQLDNDEIDVKGMLNKAHDDVLNIYNTDIMAKEYADAYSR